MKTMTELFNGGVVTSRVGALLNSGELQRADDCIYRLNDPALWRAPGRTAYNSSALGSPSPVKGLAYTDWNDQTAQLLATVGTSIYRSPFTGITGSWTEMSSPGKIAGAVSASTTFTATTGNPFTADVVGSRVYVPASVTTSSVYVTATSGAADGSGRYAAITVDQTITGATSIGLDWGVYPNFALAATTSVLGTTRWGNSYFIQNGFDPVQRVSWRRRGFAAGVENTATLVVRPAALNPVVTIPTITTTAPTAGAWTSLLASGYFWFLITEIYAPGGDLIGAEKNPSLKNEIIESVYLGEDPTSSDPNATIGRPIPIALTSGSASAVPLITFPTVIANDGTDGRLATNWGVYMYGPTTLNTDPPALSLFRRVAAPSIFTTAITLQETTTAPQLVYASTAVGAGFGATAITNPSNMLSAPNNVWTGTTAIFGLPVGDNSSHAEKLGYVFSAAGAYATAIVVGVEVGVKCSGNDAFPIVQVGTTGGKTGIKTQTRSGGLASQLGVGTVLKYGGPTDIMGINIVAGELAANVQCTVGVGGSGALRFDSVYVKLYFTGNAITLNGPAYRVVTYRDQIGIAIDDPANFAPPLCSTMETFQGSLVTNDLNTDGAIRFSLPGRPESFPKPYILDFVEHKINYIGRLAACLIVGFQSAVKRVNYLPRETDTDLSSGLVHEDITTDHGIPGPFCAARLHIPGRGVHLVYASTTGMFITNGIWTVPLNVDLDWANTVKLTALGTAVLRVYAKEQLLALYYCPTGATHSMNTRVMYFSYQSDKMKGMQMPAVGPCVVSGRSSCEANINGVHYLLTGHETTGVVYVEDSGVAIPSGYRVRLTDDSNVGDGKATASVDVKLSPFVRTRKFYPASMERDGFGEKVYLMFSSYGTNSVTASSNTTLASTTVTSSAAFGSVVAGMRVLGTGIDPGTIVVAVGSTSSLTISRAANATGTAVTLTFDTGTLGIGIRGSGLGEAVRGITTNYVSTLVGDLVMVNSQNFRRGFELQVEKVPLTFDSNGDTLTWADLGVNMRLHSITYVLNNAGLPDSNRNAA